MLQDQRDCLPQILQAFFMRRALAIGAGRFGAISDVPWAVLLDDCGEFVAHTMTHLLTLFHSAQILRQGDVEPLIKQMIETLVPKPCLRLLQSKNV
jgi:hypothetical protein